MTYNLLEGGTGRIDPLAEVIRLAGADVVVAQEAWDEGLFHKLADRVGMDRFWAGNPRNEEGAVGVISRWGIREAVNHGALDRRLTRGALHVIVRREKSGDGGQKMEGDLAIVGVHLHAGELLADEAVRLGELEGVFEIGKLFQGREHVLAGDFNASHPLQRIDLGKARGKTRERAMAQGGEIPRDVVRRVLERGYVDAHALHHGAEEFGCSMTTAHPAMRTDYVFVTAGLAPAVRGCEVFRAEMGRFASDHYPVVAEIGV